VHRQPSSNQHLTLQRTITLLVVALALAQPLVAQDRQVQTATFIIEHGLSFTSRTDANGETVSVSSGKLSELINNQKKLEGTGQVTFWSRTVPDSFFSALGSRAKLIVFNFDPMMDNVYAFLGQIETPAGPRTTLGVLPRDPDTGKVITPGPGQFPGIRGQWVILPASSVGGTNFDDLVIQVTVVVNSSPLNLGTTRLALVGHATNPPFPSDAIPGGMHFVDPATRIGSFYGETTVGGQTVPVRAFSSSLFPALWAHLLAVRTLQWLPAGTMSPQPRQGIARCPASARPSVTQPGSPRTFPAPRARRWNSSAPSFPDRSAARELHAGRHKHHAGVTFNVTWSPKSEKIRR
jgi:hypothetical protein